MRAHQLLSIDAMRERVAKRKPIPGFICDVCGRVHPSLRAAEVCGGAWQEPKHAVGDIVVMEFGYGWFDGDPDWVLQNRGYAGNSDVKTHAFWVVVTDITAKDERHVSLNGEPDAHKFIYHVATLGLKNGMELYGGWTTPDTHKALGAWSDTSLNKLEPPPSVVKAAKALVGKRFDRLL